MVDPILYRKAVDNMNELYHHGVKGQKWGIRKGPPYPLDRNKTNSVRRLRTVLEVSNAAKKIKSEVDKYKNGGPAGNQNCKMCTWAMEMQFRGKNVLPRPVYSPRDVEFSIDGYNIVKNPKKLSIRNRQDIIDTVSKAGDGSRFYTHINFKDSSGGHEFIIANINHIVTVVDAQDGLVVPIKSPKASVYTEDINYDNSFLVRMDNKEINRKVLSYNDHKYITKWDDDADIKYMLENGMLSDDDIAYLENMKHSVSIDESSVYCGVIGYTSDISKIRISKIHRFYVDLGKEAINKIINTQ